MRRQTSLLVRLVRRIDHLPWPSAPVHRPRGRPKTYADRLILKALVMMIMRRLSTASAWLTFLEQDDTMARPLRPLLYAHGGFPTRRTWERRLAVLPQHLPGLIGCVGRHLVALFTPWTSHGRATAVDSTALKPSAGVWHKKHKAQGEMPHTALDTKRDGRSPGGTAGGTAGNCLWPCRWGRSGSRWPRH